MANAIISKQFQTNAMTTSGPMEPENNDSDTFSDDDRTTSTPITAPISTKSIKDNDDHVKNILKGRQRNEDSAGLGVGREDEDDDENEDGDDELANSLLVSPDKLGPADRALYEKLRQQEREEREEIERELREQEQGLTLHGTTTSTSNSGLSLSPGSTALPHSMALSHHAQQLRAREKEVHLAQERMLIKSERELDLSTTGGNGGHPGRSSSASSSPVNNSSGTPAARSSTPNGISSNSSGQKSANTGSSSNNNNKSGNSNSKFNTSTSNRSSANGLHSSSSASSKLANHGVDGGAGPGSHNSDLPQHINKLNLPPTPEEFRTHLGLPGSAAAANSFLSSFPFGHPFAAAHAHLALGGHPLLGGRDIKGMMLDGTGLGGGNPLLGAGGGTPHHPPHPLVNPFHPILPNHSAFPSPPSPADRYGTPGGPANPPTASSLHGHHPGAPSSSPPSSTRSPDVEDSMQPSPAPDDDDPNGENRSHNWTFEEQFKQLYELSEDPKRKEFLDDLFAFMQKRGTPVNRIPIMAKQTLDLYELFRLVVSKGGLVEVINKKLWREITKGLNLPSSITSAAFTLRTQYMKYLYPYECDKLKLSNPSELQAAIDGNRREGRRSSYGYDMSPGPTLVPSSHPLNGGLMNGKLGRTSPLSFESDRPDMRHLANSQPQGLGLNTLNPLNSLNSLNSLNTLNPALMPLSHHIYSSMITEKLRHASPLDEDSLPPTPLPAHHHHHNPHQPPHPAQQQPPHPTHRGLTERDALAMEAASRAMEEATRKMEHATRTSGEDAGGPPPRKRPLVESSTPNNNGGGGGGTPAGGGGLGGAVDRPLPGGINVNAMHSAHFKITSRNDGRSEIDTSLVVSMEINGIMYQGVLFAQHPHRLSA